MKLKTILYTIAIILLASLLSACSGRAGVANSWPGLTTDDDTAYLTYNNHVYAIQLSNGMQKWRFPTEPDTKITFYAEPELSDDGQLIVGGYNNVLYSLNPENGQKNWEFTAAENRYIASSLATEKGIFAPNADKKLFALDSDGNLRWVFSTQGDNWAKPVSDSKCECLYLASMDHLLYSIDPDSGALFWSTEALGGSLVGTPAMSENGTLYIGTFGNELLAINAEDGKIKWRIPTEGWVWSGPALHDDQLFFGDLNGYFYAINATTGEPLWQLTPDQLDGPISGTPLVFEDLLVIATESGSLHVLNTEGDPQWTQIIGGNLYTPPVAAGDLLLVASTDTENLLVALTKEGARKWTFVSGE